MTLPFLTREFFVSQKLVGRTGKDLFYKEIIAAKNSQKIPVFASGKAAHSKYAPEREARNFGAESDGAKFAVILGIAGGYHIKSFLERNQKCKILCIEKSREDYDFLKSEIPCVKEISMRENFSVAFPENLQEEIFKNYFPAVHGDLSILTMRAWADEDKILYEKISQEIEGSLKKIAADFSVQSHFGALWQKNIFCNLKTLQKMQANLRYASETNSAKIDTKKIAAIIAAGPSLDGSAKKIKDAREKYFVIATDTSFKALMRTGIVPDAAVSIDAQSLSANHFIGKKSHNTIFVLSLDSDASIANALYENSSKIIFCASHHPLASFAARFCETPFPLLESGSGTVTIAAADFAKKCGFEKIQVFGADFAYSRGKPYALGTYLDELYRATENKIESAEKKFSSLMFRTPLEKISLEKISAAKNQVLDSYKNSFTQWLSVNAEFFEYKNFLWSANLKKASALQADFFSPRFNMNSFKDALSKGIECEIEKMNSCECEIDTNSPFSKIALPYLAFLRKKNPKTFCATDDFLLALNKLLWYNKNS